MSKVKNGSCLSLIDKVAVITGASSGISFAVSNCLPRLTVMFYIG